MRRGARAALLAIAALTLGPELGHAAAPPAAPAISLAASPAQIAGSRPVTLSGTVTGAPAASTVQLYASPYPYPVASLIASTVTSADGSYSFTVRPDRNTRYRVLVAGTTVQALVQVGVSPLTISNVKALTLGRAQVVVVAFHPRDLHWGNARVRWWFASPASGEFVAAPSTRAYRLSPSVVVLRSTIALAAGRYRWRACLEAPEALALLNPGRPPGCAARGYQGSGSLPVGFPGPVAVARAASYLAGRTGRTAFAVVDTEGRLSGTNVHWTFTTASVVKAMLLVAYLRRLDAMGQHTVDSYSDSFLYPMIHVSDNNAATQCWSIVGDSGLYSVAAAAGMTEFSVSGLWGTAQLSPADQARFFFEMDSLIPREFVGYARYLLSTIIAWQSFGIPVVARPLGYSVFFKDGSEPTALGQLVHQVARLEGHGRTFSMAVMTDGDPTMQYGIDTLQGVAQALLG